MKKRFLSVVWLVALVAVMAESVWAHGRVLKTYSFQGSIRQSQALTAANISRQFFGNAHVAGPYYSSWWDRLCGRGRYEVHQGQ